MKNIRPFSIGSMANLEPNLGPVAEKFCKDCENYAAGGICNVSKYGTTSALENAGMRPCFRPKGGVRVHSSFEAQQICPSCGRVLSVTKFPNVDGHPSRVCGKCLQLESEEERLQKVYRRWDAFWDERRRLKSYIVCSCCGKSLPSSYFTTMKNGKRYNKCKSCVSNAHKLGWTKRREKSVSK